MRLRLQQMQIAGDRCMAYTQLIVGFRPSAPSSERMELHARTGARLTGRMPDLHAHIVTVPKRKLSSCISSYTACQHVRYVEPNRLFRVKPVARGAVRRPKAAVTRKPNDPLLGRQWGIMKISALQAWSLARNSSPAVRIAILDTGIDPKHPDLAGRIVHSKNFSSSGTTDDLYGHGTHTAGIAAAIANNRTGVAGMSYNKAKLMNIKVLGDDGAGSLSSVAKGILYAARRGAHVISMSLGAPGVSKVLQDAVATAARKGAVLVGAAGNDGRNTRNYPAAYPQVIAVAATGRNDRKASFSNYGAAWVDVAAPGVGILSTLPTHANVVGVRNYGFESGTSQATPLVSGLAALLKAAHPKLTRSQIRRAIEQGTDRIFGSGVLFRHGRINARKAQIIAQP
jgi:thermitase